MANATSAAVRPYRAIPSLREALIGTGTGLGLALIAFSSGGYFATAWGWGALAALTLIAGYLVVGTAVRPPTIALVSLGGLAGFGAWTWLALFWTDDTAGTVLEGQRVLQDERGQRGDVQQDARASARAGGPGRGLRRRRAAPSCSPRAVVCRRG